MLLVVAAVAAPIDYISTPQGTVAITNTSWRAPVIPPVTPIDRATHPAFTNDWSTQWYSLAIMQRYSLSTNFAEAKLQMAERIKTETNDDVRVGIQVDADLLLSIVMDFRTRGVPFFKTNRFVTVGVDWP